MSISLFHLENQSFDTASLSNWLHDPCVEKFEQNIANFVGAKYACGVSSATNAIFLALHNKKVEVEVPSIIPPVVINAIHHSGCTYRFRDDVDWVGDSYVLHDFGDYKIIDSAQKLERDQFKKEAKDHDLMLFSFYPTKPVGSIDGGMIVSNDKEKISWFKKAVLNGMDFSHHNWERRIVFPGWKMYLSAPQAIIAQKNFDRLEAKYDQLAQIRERYNQALGLRNTSNHLYRIRVKDNQKALEELAGLGVTCGWHYKCCHNIPAYLQNVSLPKSEEEELRTLSIPFHEKLSEKEVDTVLKAVKSYLLK